MNAIKHNKIVKSPPIQFVIFDLSCVALNLISLPNISIELRNLDTGLVF